MPPLTLIIPLAAAIMLAEAMAAALQPAARRRRLLPGLISGLCLMAAWLAAQHSLPEAAILALLMAAFAAHLIDLRRRW